MKSIVLCLLLFGCEDTMGFGPARDCAILCRPFAVETFINGGCKGHSCTCSTTRMLVVK